MKSYSSREVIKILLADGCMKFPVLATITSSNTQPSPAK